jgi:GNAT superfamily N-acetyltransferase
MVIIRKYSPKDMLAVAKLIRKTFSKYNSNEGTPEAIQAYIDKYDPKQMGEKQVRERLESTKIFFVAVENKRIIGMVRGKKGKLVNLFVDGKYHEKGIGKKLMKKFEEKGYDERNAINIKASIFAVPFYEKLGFKKTTGQRNMRGLIVQPMKKKITIN